MSDTHGNTDVCMSKYNFYINRLYNSQNSKKTAFAVFLFLVAYYQLFNTSTCRNLCRYASLIICGYSHLFRLASTVNTPTCEWVGF